MTGPILEARLLLADLGGEQLADYPLRLMLSRLTAVAMISSSTPCSSNRAAY
jgi:hypothetical protein